MQGTLNRFEKQNTKQNQGEKISLCLINLLLWLSTQLSLILPPLSEE